MGYPLSESEGDEDDEGEDSTNNETPISKLASDSGDSRGEVEEVGGWGNSKRDYYNADAIETEADALEEEAEAKRLQQKKLQKLSEADFGFDEKEWLGEGYEDGEHDVVTELLKEVEITSDMGTEDRLRLLQTRYPEFNSLADEYLQLQPLLEQLHAEMNALQTSQCFQQKQAPLTAIKYRALAAYIGALAMYFAILTSTAKSGDGSAALDPIELRDHSIMDSLLQCRKLWSKIKDLRAPNCIPTETFEDERADDADVSHINAKLEVPITTLETTSRTDQEQHTQDAVSAEASKSRISRIRAAEKDLADLSSILPTKPTPYLPVTLDHDSDSDFGEEVVLDVRTAAEKAARKKSLRFYTSQIAQRANRRADAGRDAGGDTDLPYRERLRDRQARLNAEAEKRGKKLDSYGRGKSLGTNLGDNESEDDEKDFAAADAVRREEDGYYELLTQASKNRKAGKVSRHAAIPAAKATEASLPVVEDGKRAVGYVTKKNKRLTRAIRG